MDITTDPKVDLFDAVPVSLGGRDWLFAPTMLRQNRKIYPHLPVVVDMINRIDGVFREIRAEKAADPGSPLPIAPDDRLLQRLGISDSEIGAMIAVVHAALTRVYPKLALDDFENLDIRVLDLIPALRAVLAQSGATKPKKDGDPPGEAQAASR